ncbi:MAG TPA: transcription termination factor NusA [Gammaproteobacteria bacterium]|nr:transcription termination factor NusA [Gammaproteobacteria bacterium]
MNKDILLIVDSLSNEKGVDKSVIFEAVEAALAAVAARRYEDDVSIRVSIDQKTGDYETFRFWTISEDPEEVEDFPGKYLLLQTAVIDHPGLVAGDVIEEPIESVEFGRIEAQQAKQVLMQKVREAERKKIEDRYQKRIGELITGVIKKATHDSIILDLGDGAEGLITRDEMIPREVVRTGDRLRGYLYAIRGDKRGPQLLISRTHPQMLAELFKIEVPEIGEQVIEIKAVARDPGSRAKIAVKTNDGRIDPIGACVGMRGARVQAVSGELGGERIDIVLWDDNPVQLVINAMAPAEVVSIMADEETKIMDVAVREDQLSQAIGRNGQNVRLASDLTGWKLNVMTAQEANEKHTAEAERLKQNFMQELNLDETIAAALVQDGYTSLDELAFAAIEEIAAIPGLDTDTANDLQDRARDLLLAKELEAQLNVSEPAQDLLDLPGMTAELAYQLANNGIITQEDLAEQAVDDISAIEGLDEQLAAKLIMAARAPWFAEDEPEKK